MTHSIVTASIAGFVLLFSLGCGEDATRSGNDLMCHSGNCSSSCDDEGTAACNVMCENGSNCDARCNAGQSCNFDCQAGAVCRFDCTAGACQAAGSGDCSCSGDCTGTCGMTPVGMTDGGTGGSCLELCGSPTSPGYATCAAACD